MERTSSSGLARTISDQLVEKVAAAFKSTATSSDAAESVVGGTLSRKSSRQSLISASPGRSSTTTTTTNNNNSKNSSHIRKSRSAQLKIDLEDLSSGAALSRASSASLGLSFSFTGFTMPPEEIADSNPFSDDEIPEDLEVGVQRQPRFQTEPTLPIYLKARIGELAKTDQAPIETWLRWSGSVLYEVSSYMIFLYKALLFFPLQLQYMPLEFNKRLGA